MADTIAYVRNEDAPRLPPPASMVGLVGWLRTNLFSSVGNTVLTILALLLFYWVLRNVLDWALFRAAWTGENREACAAPGTGACWPFVQAKFAQWIYGFFPIDQRWRVNIVFLIAGLSLAPMLIPSVPYKGWNAAFLLFAFPIIAYILLSGGHVRFGFTTFIALSIILAAMLAYAIWAAKAGGGVALQRNLVMAGTVAIAVMAAIVALSLDFGLEPVDYSQWGGLTLTLIVSVTAMVCSFPLGILLALGRRSEMPVIKYFSICFIEVMRGMPLITLLFMASNMLPLLLPPGTNFDKLTRALILTIMFSAAYLAEVIRGGLQAIPKGQTEAARALGLSYWQDMGLITLPQAIKIVIPGIVNSFISLFKDTTLVTVIGLYDLLSIVITGFADANWASPTTGSTGYLTAAAIFWVFCFAMSRYSQFIERQLNTGHRR
jgi:general L-amino acid transport system permease protein